MERRSVYPRDHRGWKSVILVLACALVALSLTSGRPPRFDQIVPAILLLEQIAKDKPKTLFVFLAGLEGTGHHLYAKLYREQSSKLQDMQLKQDLVRLQTSLYNDGVPEQGLFTGALAFQRKKTHPDGNQLFELIVQQLNATNGKVLRWLESNPNNNTATLLGTFPIPLNAVFVRGPFGMMSYPNYILPSRPLQYPDLHLLYRACDAANVSCGHVYLHRDPYEIIESTVTKRHFGQEDDQIVLYTTMMAVLRAQLIDHSDRSIGCLDFNHLEGHDLNLFLDLFGVSEQAFQNTYNPPKNAANLTVSPYLQIYMDTFVETSKAVWQTCMTMSKDGWFS